MFLAYLLVGYSLPVYHVLPDSRGGERSLPYRYGRFGPLQAAPKLS